MSNSTEIRNFLADWLTIRTNLPSPLHSDQLDLLSEYLQLFIKWNLKFGFSAWSSVHDITTRLILPSLILSILVPSDSNSLDLGTGAGIPGIPLAISRPDIKMALLETGTKPAEFLQACKSALRLDNVSIINRRAEEAAHDMSHRNKFDLTLARSFAPLPIVIEIASAFTHPGGSIVIQCQGSVSSGIADHSDSMRLVGCALDRVGAIHPANDSLEPLNFIRLIQTAPAPSEYPRPWKKMKNHPLWP